MSLTFMFDNVFPVIPEGGCAAPQLFSNLWILIPAACSLYFWNGYTSWLGGVRAKFFNSSAASSSSQPMASMTSLNVSLLHSNIPLIGLTASEIWYPRRSSSKSSTVPFCSALAGM
jgi:hypothetical protein